MTPSWLVIIQQCAGAAENDCELASTPICQNYIKNAVLTLTILAWSRSNCRLQYVIHHYNKCLHTEVICKVMFIRKWIRNSLCIYICKLRAGKYRWAEWRNRPAAAKVAAGAQKAHRLSGAEAGKHCNMLILSLPSANCHVIFMLAHYWLILN